MTIQETIDALTAENERLTTENDALRLQLLLQEQLLGTWRELLEAYQFADEDRASQEPLV